MKKNAVILILTAVCLLEFVFIITAWNRRPSGGMTAAQEENGEEEEITEEGEAADVQEDAALREKADTEFQAAGSEENPGIDFSEGLEINIDGRSFAAEDAPENEAEKAVVLFYVADFLPNNLMRAENLAQQNGLFRTELENHRRADQNGERTNAYILHNIETAAMDSGMRALEDFGFDAAFVEGNNLTNYKIVKLTWTEEKEIPGNSGNGLHERYFLCGTSEADPQWRIYSFSMIDAGYGHSEERPLQNQYQ